MSEYEITYHTNNTEGEIGQTGLSTPVGNKQIIQANSEEEARTIFHEKYEKLSEAETNIIDDVKKIK
ncbi:hypothetical protein IQ283_05350 [Alkalihalobacillus hwajinpoensis]|uniref:hypothetical protein n=1 Tax=Guptibacillus hwajinpoensis TaxID=208199 RepID=UPI001883A779|nr:hypothetical protein [Pseudalkalibacillus hwajinpoensis]MBF0706027.1 hypothetical protein [Pseudalkalibacillus hwajinpoensis]